MFNWNLHKTETQHLRVRKLALSLRTEGFNFPCHLARHSSLSTAAESETWRGLCNNINFLRFPLTRPEHFLPITFTLPLLALDLRPIPPSLSLSSLISPSSRNLSSPSRSRSPAQSPPFVSDYPRWPAAKAAAAPSILLAGQHVSRAAGDSAPRIPIASHLRRTRARASGWYCARRNETGRQQLSKMWPRESLCAASVRLQIAPFFSCTRQELHVGWVVYTYACGLKKAQCPRH